MQEIGSPTIDSARRLTRNVMFMVIIVACIPLSIISGFIGYFFHAAHVAITIFIAGSMSVVIMTIILSRKMVPPLSGVSQVQEIDNREGNESGDVALQGEMEAGHVDVIDEGRTLEYGQVAQPGNLSSIGELAGGIAHEINNPLAIMVEEAGWIEDLLAEGALRESEHLEEITRALKQIKTQGARCKEITHNLLSFARQTDSKIKEVQLNEVIDEVVGLSRKKLATNAVEIKTRLADNLPTVHVSPSEMQQVFLNLIHNALDALDAKGGILEITTKVENNYILIDIADTGHGIPKPILARIFDPFFTTKPVGKGTGLGLSICYGIINRIGGDIKVDSEVGVGTTFHLRIPVGGLADKEKRPLVSKGPLDIEYEVGIQMIRGELAKTPTVVLVVDDEPLFVEAIAKRLTKRNLVVLKAFSGQEAIERLEGHRNVDVVIMDVKMSGMDGIELLREIKKNYPIVEVILLSVHTTVESAIEGMKLGAFDYLMKPCDMMQLFTRIERAKAKKSRQEQSIMEARIKEITLRGRG